MTQHQHKILSALIISFVTFFGLMSLSVMIGQNQSSLFLISALELFIFQVVWIAFVFDLHLKRARAVELSSVQFRHLLYQGIVLRFKHFFHWPYLRHFINYLVLPTILFWSSVILLYLNPFSSGLKLTIVVLASFAFLQAYWHMKEHLTSHLVDQHYSLRMLTWIKVLVAYASFAATLGICFYFGLPSTIVFYFVLASSLLLMHQALISYGFNAIRLSVFTLCASLLLGLVGVWVYHNWNYQYFTGGLILLALYNTLWGFAHHYTEKTLDTKTALEYLVFGILIVSIIFATHNFGVRVV
jgi:hypothetical protein